MGTPETVRLFAADPSTIDTGKPMTETRDTVILGSGCAGLTAALYTARAGLKPLVLEGPSPEGSSRSPRCRKFSWLAGWDSRAELINDMKKQAARFGAEYQHAQLESAKVNAHPIKLHTSAGEVGARTLIVASGASARWLGLPNSQAGVDTPLVMARRCNRPRSARKPYASFKGRSGNGGGITIPRLVVWWGSTPSFPSIRMQWLPWRCLH